jgi:hypothetical protein
MKIMKRFGPRGLVLMMTMSILFCGAATLPAEDDEPGPFERLFRAMRHKAKEPKHKSEHRNRHKQIDETDNAAYEEPNPRGKIRGGNKPPSERNTRSATKAASKKGEDLPYGTPVPGKPGLVTSPYSPNGGYIDIRGFAPGTPVKDPYSGKIFLTP